MSLQSSIFSTHMNGDVARAHAQLYDVPDCRPALKKEKGTHDDKKNNKPQPIHRPNLTSVSNL